MNFKEIEAINNMSIKERDRYREAVLKGEVDSKGFQRIKHKYPYYGHVLCRHEDMEFLMYSANDDVVAWNFFWEGHYEKEVMHAWMELTRDADIVFDIGAYTGCMSMLAAINNPHCTIYAFEAIPRTCERFSINMKVNNIAGQMKLINAAASNQASEMKMHMPRQVNFLGTGNSIYNKPHIEMVDTTIVNTIPLDSFLAELDDRTLSCVKLDVEGHELQALEGMTAIIDKHRPSMIVEVWKHEFDEVNEFFERRDYDRQQLRGMDWVYTPKS